MNSVCGGPRDCGRGEAIMCHAEACTLNTQKSRVFMTTNEALSGNDAACLQLVFI